MSSSLDNVVNLVKNACLPAKIYLGIFAFNAISSLYIKKMNITTHIAALSISVLIGFLIFLFDNYLCNQGYEFIVWIIIIGPFVYLLKNMRKMFKI